MSTVVLHSLLLVILLPVLLWLTGYAVKWVLRSAVSEVSKPQCISTEAWVALTSPLGQRAGASLGFLERALSFVVFFQGAYALLGGWLILKLGSKWQTWSSITKVPEANAEVADEQWLVAKRLLAAWLSQRFLIGTLSNVLLGWLIYLIIRVSTDLVRIWS